MPETQTDQQLADQEAAWAQVEAAGGPEMALPPELFARANAVAARMMAGEPVDLMALLGEDAVLEDDPVDAEDVDLPSFEGIDPGWESLVTWAAGHLGADQASGMGKMLALGALKVLRAQLSRDPEGSRDSLIQLMRRAIGDLHIDTVELYGAEDPEPEPDAAHVDG